MPQISKLVRTQLLARLQGADANGQNSFNLNMNAALQSYGLSPQVIAWQNIDWTANTHNFIWGRISPDEIDSSGGQFTYPLVTIDTLNSRNTNYAKYANFAGPVQAVIDVHFSWKSSGVLQDFSSWSDALEDALYTTLLSQSYQRWSNGILPEWGSAAFTKDPQIRAGGYGWRRSHTLTAIFEVVTV